jgi:hypothetical protein
MKAKTNKKKCKAKDENEEIMEVSSVSKLGSRKMLSPVEI